MNLLKPTNGPAFLEIICTLIVNLLQPSNTNSKVHEKVDERELYLTVAREALGLLDAIIYSLPPEYHYQLSRMLSLFYWNLCTRRLAIIPQTANVLTTMLSNQQPTSFLECSTRTLSYLSTRVFSRTRSLRCMLTSATTGTGLFRPLMSFTDDVPESARDFSKLPQVDRMCALLIDPNRTGVKVWIPPTNTVSCEINLLSSRVTPFARPCSPLSSRSQWHTTTL
jgi:hypothetical protein